MASPKNLKLLVGILNKYIFYFLMRHSRITAVEINGLIELINEHISSIRSDGKFEEAKEAIGFFERTMDSVRLKQSNPDLAELFLEITV
jgi:hypothetical protein